MPATSSQSSHPRSQVRLLNAAMTALANNSQATLNGQRARPSRGMRRTRSARAPITAGP